jgi:hypothetical protein
MLPSLSNVLHEGRITGDFADYPVADFGQNYKFQPDHKGRCNIGEGALFSKAGSLVFVRGEQALVVNDVNAKEVRFFLLDRGTTTSSGNPETYRIAFEKSYVLMDNLVTGEPLIRLGG